MTHLDGGDDAKSADGDANVEHRGAPRLLVGLTRLGLGHPAREVHRARREHRPLHRAHQDEDAVEAVDAALFVGRRHREAAQRGEGERVEHDVLRADAVRQRAARHLRQKVAERDHREKRALLANGETELIRHQDEHVGQHVAIRLLEDAYEA